MRSGKMTMEWLVCGNLLMACASAQAAAINYGNFGPVSPGISFLTVTESSGTDPVPLYGPPTPYATGLDFNPIGFLATAAGGEVDLTEGQLNSTIAGDLTPPLGTAIRQLSMFESGDFTLVGSGSAATQASAGAIVQITVTAIDGLNVAPIQLIPVNASVGFNLIANAGLVQPWSLGIGVNIESQLTAAGIPFALGATRIDVVINNSLVALSEPTTIASIAKKQFAINLDPVPGRVLPEPATACLIGVGLCMATRRRLPRRADARP